MEGEKRLSKKNAASYRGRTKQGDMKGKDIGRGGRRYAKGARQDKFTGVENAGQMPKKEKAGKVNEG